MFEFTACMVLQNAQMLGGPGCQPNHSRTGPPGLRLAPVMHYMEGVMSFSKSVLLPSPAAYHEGASRVMNMADHFLSIINDMMSTLLSRTAKLEVIRFDVSIVLEAICSSLPHRRRMVARRQFVNDHPISGHRTTRPQRGASGHPRYTEHM